MKQFFLIFIFVFNLHGLIALETELAQDIKDNKYYNLSLENEDATYFDLLPECILYYISNFLSVKDPSINFLLEKLNLNTVEARDLAKRYLIESYKTDNKSIIDQIKILNREINKIKQTINLNNLNKFKVELENYINLSNLKKINKDNKPNFLELQYLKTNIKFYIYVLNKLNKHITYKNKNIQHNIYNFFNNQFTQLCLSLLSGITMLEESYEKSDWSYYNQVQTCLSGYIELKPNILEEQKCGYGPFTDCCISKFRQNCELYFFIFYPALLVITTLNLIFINRINKHLIKPTSIEIKKFRYVINNYKSKIGNLKKSI